MDVAAWLERLGLTEYQDAFRANGVDGAVLAKLTVDDLREIGVAAVGHRRKLLDAIAELSQDAPPPRPPPAADGASEERRQVCVLFADLAGYTRLSTELDAEDLHAIRRAFTDAVERAVAEMGGGVERHIGDCVMAVFGAPMAHGNDAERAVRAALAIQASMPALAATFGRPIAAHVGVASGEVVAAADVRGGFAVTGETVNLASRLTSDAAAGEILLSGAIRDGLGPRIVTGDMRRVDAKGFADPVKAWKLIGLAAPASRQAHPIVGRRAELRQIEAAISGCRDLGAGQALLLRGDAGIGKTRLGEEAVASAARAGFRSATGLVMDFGSGQGWDAIRSVLRDIIAAEPNGVPAFPEEDRSFLAELCDMPLDAAERGRLAAMDHATRQRERMRALMSAVRTSASHHPLLILIEDIHWADAGSLVALAELAAATATSPVVLLMTTRIEGDPTRGGWRPDVPLLSIDLAPLRRDDALALAAGLHGASARFVERCIERAAGNPLFLEQLLRHAEQKAEAGVPDSVQSLVQARLDQLAPAEKEALQAASVLGQRFTREALDALLERPADLEPLVVHHLLRPQEGSFLFAHALIRDGTYATLVRSRRRMLHGRAAEWFRDMDAPLHAEHLERADDPSAPAAYHRAAVESQGRYRFDHALTLTERGLAIATEAADLAELSITRADLLLDLGDALAAAEAYGETLGAAPGAALACRALIGRASAERILDRLDEALADLDAAESLAAEAGLVEAQARLHTIRGNIYFPRGDVAACMREQAKALDLARAAGSLELEAAALGGLADAEYMEGRMLSAAALFRRCADLAREAGFTRVEAANRPMTAISQLFSGDTRAALAEAEAAVSLARSIGHHRAECIAHHVLFYCHLTLLRHAEAKAAVEEALRLARQIRSPRFEAEALAFLAIVEHIRGRAGAARVLAGEALDLLRTTSLSYMGPYFYGLIGRFAATPDEARAALADGETLLADNGIGHNHLLYREEAIETCLQLGAWSEAERHAEELERFAARDPSPWTDFLVARGRALAAWGRGDRSAALVTRLLGLRAEAERAGFLSGLVALQACPIESSTGSAVG